MNKSLLVTLAIMPTLLSGCKSTELKTILFDDGIVEFNSVNEKKTLIGHTKPAITGLTFTWESDATDWKDYFSIEQKEIDIKGDYEFTFICLKDFSKIKGVNVNCVYKEVRVSIPVTYTGTK